MRATFGGLEFVLITSIDEHEADANASTTEAST